MAEVISLASFDLDTKKMQDNLSSLQEKYFDLKKEQEAYTNQSKETKKQIDLLTKAQEALANASGDNSDAIAENEKELQKLIQKEKDLFKAQENVRNSMSITRREITQTTTTLNTYRDSEQKLQSIIDVGTEALNRQITTRADAKKANSDLNKIVDQLNPNVEEEAKLIKQLNAQIDKNTDFIKENSSETTKQKLNVGNYTESIIDAYKALEEEAKSLEDCRVALQEQIDATQEGTEEYKVYIAQLNVLNVQINNVSDSMAEARGETEDLGAVSKLLSGNFLDIASASQEAGGAQQAITGAFAATRVGILGALQAGIAFIATPIGAALAALALAVGAVVGAFKFAKASLESTEEGSNRLAVVTGAVTGVFKGLFKIIRPFGEFLADVFITHLENVGKAAQAMAGFLADALDFLGFDESAKGVRDFTNEVVQSSNAAAKLADSENKLNKSLRESEGRILKIQRAAEILRQQRDDESKSISQRIAANTQLGKTLQIQAEYEKSLAKQALANANLRIAAEGGVKKSSTESLEARAEALNKIEEINERISGQESEQLANLNSLRKEAADAEKERQEKLTEAQLALSQARIDKFIAEQGFKRKSAEEEYQFNYQLYNKEYADLKLQLQKKKITQAQFDAQQIQLRNDYLAKNAELTIQNAQLELDAELSKNQRILDSDKFLSEQQLALKKQALADDLAAQQEFEKIRLENGQINQAEYNAAINAINEENRIANAELEEQRRISDQEKKLADLEALKITNEENFLAQAEIQKAQNEILRQQEIDNAEQTGADISLINTKYAKIQEDIEKAKRDNKIQLASDAFGSLASIFGEESKAGKAAAIAQATIDTYKAATSAYSSLAGIPIVGPVLGAIAAGAAVAAGIANVKKITATKSPTISKTPSYATGVIGLRGIGTGTSDDINLNASAGESIINANSTAMFPELLGAINQAGGGVGLNGSSNILDQTNIKQKANDTQLVSAIAEAVALGAELGSSKGSQNGIKGLSSDRKVMQDAKF